MEKRCERCGRQPLVPSALGPILDLDYCAACSRDLCRNCMAAGCCGKVPATSGIEADSSDEALSESARRIWEKHHGGASQS